ncbi:MAG: hypothetical protein FWD98_05900 [Defluviitaleaceae bacterium]|nr:hypothetical protein [Defluviitaleaceae bacterium]
MLREENVYAETERVLEDDSQGAEVKYKKPFGFDPFTKEELIAEIMKGLDDADAGRVTPWKEVEREILERRKRRRT